MDILCEILLKYITKLSRFYENKQFLKWYAHEIFHWEFRKIVFKMFQKWQENIVNWLV